MGGLEDASFDQVARWLKSVRDIDIYLMRLLFTERLVIKEIDLKVFEERLDENRAHYNNRSLSDSDINTYIQRAKNLKRLKKVTLIQKITRNWKNGYKLILRIIRKRRCDSAKC